MKMEDLKKEIFALAQANDFAKVLSLCLEQLKCVTGTLHRLNGDGQLELIAQVGVPDFILPQVSMIPIGKGMAGLAAERKEAVQVCNLQTDSTGVAKPNAKMTQMAGSIASPILVEGKLMGTLGVAKTEPYEFGPDDMECLLDLGAEIGRFWLVDNES